MFLTVERTGSLSGAARALAVNHSTVLRRLRRLETDLGARLFERLPTGYVLTSAGEAMRDRLRGVEEGIEAAQLALTGLDTRLTGTIRVTTADTLARGLLIPGLARFRTRTPRNRPAAGRQQRLFESHPPRGGRGAARHQRSAAAPRRASGGPRADRALCRARLLAPAPAARHTGATYVGGARREPRSSRAGPLGGAAHSARAHRSARRQPHGDGRCGAGGTRRRLPAVLPR